MSRKTSECKRRYFRVHAQIPLRVEKLDAAGYAARKAAIQTPRANHEDVDAELARHLAWIELKLDRVLAAIEGRPSPTPVEPVAADISGSGVAFEAKEAGIEPGDDVFLELLIPSSPPKPIPTIGRVVKFTDGAGAGMLAVEFRVIAEEDREAIIRFTHDVEREELRRRAARDS